MGSHHIRSKLPMGSCCTLSSLWSSPEGSCSHHLTTQTASGRHADHTSVHHHWGSNNTKTLLQASEPRLFQSNKNALTTNPYTVTKPCMAPFIGFGWQHSKSGGGGSQRNFIAADLQERGETAKATESKCKDKQEHGRQAWAHPLPSNLALIHPAS